MGDWLTQPARAAELLRAKFLKAVLDSGGTPALLRNDTSACNTAISDKSWTEDPEIQKAFLHELFENAPEAITVLDTDFHVLRLNSEFTHLFGYTEEEALGRKVEALIVPTHLHVESDEMTRMLSRGEKVNLE